jgi:hypothetical protein
MSDEFFLVLILVLGVFTAWVVMLVWWASQKDR